MRTNLKLIGKVACYGRSLGGIISTELSNECDMVIIDRSFSTFDEMAWWAFGGRLATTAFKYGSYGW
jgi:hypothetical protein